MADDFLHLPSIRREAKAVGSRHYFTGTPCSHGHINRRFTISGVCVACSAAQHARPKSREICRASAKRWAADHPEASRNREKAWRKANPEKTKAASLKHRMANRDAIRADGRRRAKHTRMEKPFLKRASEAKRRATKNHATPAWADLNAIREFYRKCPAGYHVDHIVPLTHPLVCGLHVLENLQYLPASENCSKKNRFNAG